MATRDKDTNTTELGDDLPKVLVSLISHREKMNDHQDRNHGLLCICQQYDNTS